MQEEDVDPKYGIPKKRAFSTEEFQRKRTEQNRNKPKIKLFSNTRQQDIPAKKAVYHKKYFDSADWAQTGLIHEVHPRIFHCNDYSFCEDPKPEKSIEEHSLQRTNRRYFDSADWMTSGEVYLPYPELLEKRNNYINHNKFSTGTARRILQKPNGRVYFDSADWAATGVAPSYLHHPKLGLTHNVLIGTIS
eukprot:CAMPEP_0174261762 /NCGR_PEP_ID=MMETSP0439-20130205/12088_1 /TAXON_ID=0 /ORGANISM="Stereomyxa ramosa, Strain Chinc5" /LENGTH=190 /DNA_ID=CAMNT_0015346317 /DNA_START=106 /DNA_END=678 /DNA_ORIENTATION=+